jgi:hypothetical protein
LALLSLGWQPISMEREQDGLQHLAGNRYQWNGSRVGCSTWLATTINGTRAGWVAEIAITVKGTRAEKLTLTAGRPPGIRPHQPAQLDARGSTKPQLMGRESGHADLENISWVQHPVDLACQPRRQLQTTPARAARRARQHQAATDRKGVWTR